MTMFEELFALATSASLTMTISADHKAGRMTINVIPRPSKDADEPALAKALSLTATPQEFDEGFVAALQGYREVRQSLADQVEATKEVLEAAKLASVKKAADASTKARADKPSPSAAKPAIAPASGATDTASDDDAGAEGDESRPPAKGIGEAAMDLFG
jgi:PRTRC genetic system protein E